MNWIETCSALGTETGVAEKIADEIREVSSHQMDAFDDLFPCVGAPDAEEESFSGALVDGGGKTRAWDGVGEVRWIGTPAQSGEDHTAPGTRWDNPAAGHWERPPVVVIHQTWDSINGGRRWTKVWSARLAVAVAGANAVMRSQAASRRDSNRELRNAVWNILDSAYAENVNPLPLMRKTFSGNWEFLTSMPEKPASFKYNWKDQLQDPVFFIFGGGVVAAACNKIQGRAVVEKFGEKSY